MNNKAVSFRELVKARFAGTIEEWIRRNIAQYDVELSEMSIEAVAVSCFKDDELHFQAHCRCVIVDYGRTVVQRYTVDCVTLYTDGYSTVAVKSMSVGHRPCTPNIPLGDDLVPIINKSNVDGISERILTYLSKSLLIPTEPVDGKYIAEMLGLKVVYMPFDPSDSIFAELLFEDSTIDVYRNGAYIPMFFTAKTVLINKSRHAYGTSRADNNTLVHECIHWLIHRYAYKLAKQFDNDADSIACRSNRSALHTSWSPVDRMEWQANSISPRILLPESKVRSTVQESMRRLQVSRAGSIYGRVVFALSSYYHVSEQLARIRLEELGYHDENDSKDLRNTTYTITPYQALEEYARNESFRRLLESGSYAYVDYRFCNLSEKYVYKGYDGRLHITSYGIKHQSECCIPFSLSIQYCISPDGLYRGKKNTLLYKKGNQDESSFEFQTNSITKVIGNLPSSFSGTLEAHMSRINITCEELAESANIGLSTIKKYKTMSESSYKLTTVVSICIGLHLHPIYCYDMVRKAGFCFNNSKEHIAYQLLLSTKTKCSIEQCNELLREIGLNGLSKSA